MNLMILLLLYLFSVMLNGFILVFVLYGKDGKVLEFFIGVHIDAKKLLKMFDLS